MIIGGSKKQVISNIQRALAEGNLNKKVELGDPALSSKEKQELLLRYGQCKKGRKYRICNSIACAIRDGVGWSQNRNTIIKGMENLKMVTGGAIITCNHFNPLDSTIIRKFTRRARKKKLYIISQETNFAMKGFLGFLLKYTDTVPITSDRNYMQEVFEPFLESLLRRREWVLIYPEQEMWFNYRKPRTPKRGAYYYAAKYQIPVISCFVEICDEGKKDTEEFRKVRYTLHILPPLFPESGKTVRENSIDMMEKDYEQKKSAYERIYGKKCTYEFAKEDIAGWIG